MTLLRLTAATYRRRLIKPFIIATGARTHQPLLSVQISDGVHSGRGEATGMAYLGQTPERDLEHLKAARDVIEAGITRDGLADILPLGAARNALDAALWELEASRTGCSVADLLGLDPQPIESAYTIVLDSPAVMGAQARDEAWRPLLKVKLGGSPEDEADRLRSAALGAPNARKVIDANAGWTIEQLKSLAPIAAEYGYELIEQPLPAGCESDPEHRSALTDASQVLPLCADESFQTLADLDGVADLYQAVNIKLDKCGGLTPALAIRDAARARGLKIFVGCMLAPTLSIAPAHLLAQTAHYADLDGPFWFPEEPSKLTEDGLFAPIHASHWGAGIRQIND